MNSSASRGAVNIDNAYPHASALLHILAWAMIDNNVPPRSLWRIHLEVAGRLLAPATPTFLQIATRTPTGQLVQTCEDYLRILPDDEIDGEMPPSPVPLPPAHPLSAQLGFCAFERSRGILRQLAQHTSNGGFNCRRSPYSIVLEAAAPLLGQASHEEYAACDRGLRPNIYDYATLLDTAGVAPLTPKPTNFTPDLFYKHLLEHTRWMDPHANVSRS